MYILNDKHSRITLGAYNAGTYLIQHTKILKKKPGTVVYFKFKIIKNYTKIKGSQFKLNNNTCIVPVQ